MGLRFFVALLCAFGKCTFALSIPAVPNFASASRALHAQKPLQETLDDWIDREKRISLDKLLANVKPGGGNVQGDRNVADGTVVASPSRAEPDYWYQWVRDAAITANTLVDMYTQATASNFSLQLETILDAYASLQAQLQHTDNPSGNLDDLRGLGEPKFHVDGTAFAGEWGRPQRDGPALRAITLISYLRAYNASHPSRWATKESDPFYSQLYKPDLPAHSVIKADLEYTSHFWNHTSFDIWEEVDGMHFFTAMVQLRALREGTQLARAFGDHGAADWYAEQAGYLERFVRRFWNKAKGHLVATLWSRRSGLDCAVLLASLHALSSENINAVPMFPPWSDEVLVSLLALASDQAGRFPVNQKAGRGAGLEGVAIGRYPEDVYDGYATSAGHPWFLCTASSAEVLFRAAAHLSSSSSLAVTPHNLPFYSALLSSSSFAPEVNATYTPADEVFTEILERLQRVGDGFLEVVRTHASKEGGMSEQFDRETGFVRGATDLTWSYGAFLQAVRAREGV